MLLRTTRALLRTNVRIAVSPWRRHSLPLRPVLVSRVSGLLSVEVPRVLHVSDRPFGSRPTHPKSDLNFEELEALIAQSHGLSEKVLAASVHSGFSGFSVSLAYLIGLLSAIRITPLSM